MLRRIVSCLVGAAAALAVGGVARAAEPVMVAASGGAATCSVLGLAYSPGSVARVGNGPASCRPDGTWVPSTDQAAGCVYASKVYTVGARLPLPGKDQILECLSDGTWSPVPQTRKQ